MIEHCAVCGLTPVGSPEYVFKMAVLHDILKGGQLTDDVEADSQRCMRYRYKDANGHKWESTQRPAHA